MIKTLYLDMDGVLVDFSTAAMQVVGLKPPPTKWGWFSDVPGGFERVNQACTIEFWKNLKWMPDGKLILDKVENYFNKKNIYLLTTPMPNPGSGTGKMLWVKKNLPQYYKRLIISNAPKHLFASPTTLLIDDKNENVINFWVAGGKAILIPRPWNMSRNLEQNPIEFFEEQLERIKCEF